MNSERDILEANKRDHKVEITDIAISKVPLVRYREIPEEHYETLRELAKLVLDVSRTFNNCNETAVTYSLDDPEGMIDDTGSVAVSYGDEHNVDPLESNEAFHLVNSASGCVIIIMHNHPSLSKISLSDVSYLLRYLVIKMIVAVTNRGSISYIVKSDRYDRKEALKLYYDSAEKYKGADDLRQKQNVTGEFLHNCYKVGLIYEEH